MRGGRVILLIRFISFARCTVLCVEQGTPRLIIALSLKQIHKKLVLQSQTPYYNIISNPDPD